MTRSHFTTNSHTAARVEKIRKLIHSLQQGDMSRDEICDLLEMGPSGVRKYLADLAGRVKAVVAGGETIVHLAIDADQAEAYLDQLAAQASPRPAVLPRSPEWIAARDRTRHFHILEDDAHYSIRVSRAAPARDWAVAALFGAAPAAMGVHA